MPLFDQRGDNFGRVQNGRIDIGAFEVQQLVVDSADFDADGDIDGRDFLLWQRGFGTVAPNATKSDGDADNDLDVDGDDLAIWQNQYGQPAPLVAGENLAAIAALNEPVAVSAAPQEPTLTASLVDAAMALEWIDGNIDIKVNPTITEEDLDLLATLRLSDNAKELISASSRPTTGIDSSAILEETDAMEESWLSDELLESVFG